MPKKPPARSAKTSRARSPAKAANANVGAAAPVKRAARRPTPETEPPLAEAPIAAPAPAADGRGAPARLQPSVAQPCADDRGRRQAARRLFQAARKRRFRSARRRRRPHGGDARPDRRILPLRRPAGARRPGRVVAPVSRLVGLDLASAAGRGRRAGRRAGPRRQALRPSRMARQPLFRLPQAGLCADDPLGQGSRRARRRARSGDAPTRRSSTCGN